MQTLAFHLFAAQFFSRPYSRDDLVKAHTRLKTEGGFSLDGHLTIKFGAPLLEGPGETFPRDLRAALALPGGKSVDRRGQVGGSAFRKPLVAARGAATVHGAIAGSVFRA